MKYRLLTKEELSATENQFINFLALNGIPSDYWEKIKKNDQVRVNSLMEEFSDFIFDNILRNVDIIEHRSSNSFTLYYSETNNSLSLLRIETKIPGLFNFNNEFEITELVNLFIDYSDQISIIKGEKKEIEDKKMEFFSLLESGGRISKNDSLLKSLKDLAEKNKAS